MRILWWLPPQTVGRWPPVRRSRCRSREETRHWSQEIASRCTSNGVVPPSRSPSPVSSGRAFNPYRTVAQYSRHQQTNVLQSRCVLRNDTMNRSSRRYLVQRLVILLTSFLLALGLVPLVTLTTHAASNQTRSTFRLCTPPPY